MGTGKEENSSGLGGERTGQPGRLLHRKSGLTTPEESATETRERWVEALWRPGKD